jgi:hypothetical protein
VSPSSSWERGGHELPRERDTDTHVDSESIFLEPGIGEVQAGSLSW